MTKDNRDKELLAFVKDVIEKSGDDEELSKKLDRLGNGKSIKFSSAKTVHVARVVNLRSHLARTVYLSQRALDSDNDIYDILATAVDEHQVKLRYLLATTAEDSKNVLDVVFDQDTYDQQGTEGETDDDENEDDAGQPTAKQKSTEKSHQAPLFEFGKVKHFVSFLLRLQPKLLKADDSEEPLVWTLLSTLSKTCPTATMTDIVEFLCDKQPNAIKSLAKVVKTNEKGKRGDNSYSALQLAIEKDIRIKTEVVQKLCEHDTEEGTSPLIGKAGDTRKPYLHIALTLPVTETRAHWARLLAELEPDLLTETWKSGKESSALAQTPLQYLETQRAIAVSKEKAKPKDEPKQKQKDKTYSETEGIHALAPAELFQLVNDLRYLCLANLRTKSDLGLKQIMFQHPANIEIGLRINASPDRQISEEYLNGMKKHLRLHSILKYVYLEDIDVVLGKGDARADGKINDWKHECNGRGDFYMVFEWLKSEKGGNVGRVLDVVVEDMKRQHSDEAIEACLNSLKVETWNWKRFDISSQLIARVARDSVKEVYLYCSGLEAVLQGWAAPEGLPTLSNLRKVHIEARQGLVTMETMERYLENFRKVLGKNFSKVNPGKELTILESKIQRTEGTVDGQESVPSPNKQMESNDEYDWLKVMKDFASSIKDLKPLEYDENPIRIALIDDGVTDDSDIQARIETGRSWSTRYSPYSDNYNTSSYGHGTNMARRILSICPEAKLLVAKLDSEPVVSGPVTFTVESAAEAIQWAVDARVDIISMSWAINGSNNTTGIPGLTEALTRAKNGFHDHKFLLFCANPDAGEEFEVNTTLPFCGVASNDIFSIGASSTKEGKAWHRISSRDTSFSFLLPGVYLDNAVHKEGQGERQDGREAQNGSSNSCALAAGLAAMVLYSARVAGIKTTDRKWMRLKSAAGMREALENIDGDNRNKWIAVRKLFSGDEFDMSRSPHLRRRAIRETVVPKFFQNWKEELNDE